jgi:antitoxin HigA-1
MTPIRLPAHPGQILEAEFLNRLGISQTTLARTLRVKPGTVNELVRGKKGITPTTACMLAAALGTTPEYWMNLQVAYDLARVRRKAGIKRIPAAGAVDG